VPYREFLPSEALRSWVECFWTRRDEAAPSGEHRILPDGCADLVFDLTDGEGIAVGTMTKPLLIDARGQVEFFGVRFRPGRAAAFLRIPLAEITDARVPLGDIWKGFSSSAPLDVAALETELLRRLDPDRDRRVDAAIARLVASGGKARVEAVAKEIGISRQHLARQFLHHVGVSPKTFARVMRFRNVIDSLPSCPEIDWSDVAAEHGYYDQSHLIADFRELGGATPSSFHFSNR
jgi:AraC-like DNA-binding protein